MPACSAEWNERLSAAFDGEADATERAQVATHVGTCPDCGAAQAGFHRLRSALRSASAPALSPDRVRARVLEVAGPPRQRVLRRVAVAAALVLITLGGMLARRPGLDAALLVELEAQHLKAFAHGRPCEFESADPAAVSAWITANAAQAVDVPQLPNATLLGARRCKLGGRPAVALVYQVEGRGLTVFVPAEGTSTASAAAALADGSARCVVGTLGEQICAATGPARSAMAVGDDEQLVLLASAAAIGPR